MQRLVVHFSLIDSQTATAQKTIAVIFRMHKKFLCFTQIMDIVSFILWQFS